MEIMRLEAELRKQKERFSSKEKKLTQAIGEQKRKQFKSSKEVH